MIRPNTSHYLLVFLVGFFLLTSSIIIHELIHYLHFIALGSEIQEVVLLGWQQSNAEPALGWVTATASFTVNTHIMELLAYTIQLSYLVGGSLYFYRKLFTRTPPHYFAEPFFLDTVTQYEQIMSSPQSALRK